MVCGQSRGIRSSQSPDFGLDVRNVWLDKGQVDSLGSTLDSLHDGFDGSLPHSFTDRRSNSVRGFQTRHVDRMSLCSVLEPVDEGVDVWLQNFTVVDVGWVTKSLVQLRVLRRRVVKAERRKNETRDWGHGGRRWWADDRREE